MSETQEEDLTAKEIALLEEAFADEINSALTNGIGVYQPRPRHRKTAEKLLSDGYLAEHSATLQGHLPVVVKGYQLTHLGRLTYCMTC